MNNWVIAKLKLRCAIILYKSINNISMINSGLMREYQYQLFKTLLLFYNSSYFRIFRE